MKKSIFTGVILGISAIAAADSLSIVELPHPKAVYDGSKEVTLKLALDQPAETASVRMSANNTPVYINGKSGIEFTSGDDGKTFTAKLGPVKSNFAMRSFRTGWGCDNIVFTPVVKRGGKDETLTPVKLPNPIKFMNRVQISNGAQQAGGKFGEGLTFDGRDGVAVIQRIDRFDPGKGSLEGWIYMPPFIGKQAGRAIYISGDRDDGNGWTYQELTIPENSRSLRYNVYAAKLKKSFSIVSPLLEGDNWVRFMMTWSLDAKRMELFIDGKSVGISEYPYPCGGGKGAFMTIGGDIANNTVRMPAQISIDDLRLSNKTRDPAVPAGALKEDEPTVMLLNFDGDDYLK